MASEWAMKKAAHLATVLNAQSVQCQSSRILAEALDAARIEGLDEAFALATEHCKHGEFAHMGRYECIDALRVDIRIRIREMKR